MLNVGYTSIWDVDKYKECREQDIDLILFSNKDKGVTTTAEVKADAFPIMSDNKKYIFIETISNSIKGTKGCIFTSSCNYFIFYYVKYNNYLVINRNALLLYLNEHLNEYERKEAKTWSPDNSRILYYSYGILIDDETLIKNNIAQLYHSSLTYMQVKRELFGE